MLCAHSGDQYYVQHILRAGCNAHAGLCIQSGNHSKSVTYSHHLQVECGCTNNNMTVMQLARPHCQLAHIFLNLLSVTHKIGIKKQYAIKKGG